MSVKRCCHLAQAHAEMRPEGKQQDLLYGYKCCPYALLQVLSLFTICARWLSLCACSFFALPHNEGSTVRAVVGGMC